MERFGKIALLLGLVCVNPAFGSQPEHSQFGQLDTFQVQLLRVASAPGEKITPLRVMRWISAEITGTPMDTRTPPVEFQPIVRAHNAHLQVIAALAYTF